MSAESSIATWDQLLNGTLIVVRQCLADWLCGARRNRSDPIRLIFAQDVVQPHKARSIYASNVAWATINEDSAMKLCRHCGQTLTRLGHKREPSALTLILHTQPLPEHISSC